MKEKIAFPQLVGLVAEKASTTERMSELFLQELFAVVTQELADGKSVTIKGLGAFKVTNNESGKDVVFTPDKDLAEAVNAPFAQFEPVVLCDEVTDEMLSEVDAGMEHRESEIGDRGSEIGDHTFPTFTSTGSAVAEDKQKNKETEPVSLEENQEEENVGTGHALPEPAQIEPQEEPQDTKSRNPHVWLIAAAAAVALIAAWYFFAHRDKDRNDKAIETSLVAKNDTSTNTEATKPQPVVTDTIGNGNVLFTMAKKHYGDQAFWVYIARENQAQYPDYRKIKSGAILVIPPAEKYGINSDSKQSIKQANAEAMKLYKEVKAADENSQTKDTTLTKPSSNNKLTKGKGYKSTRKYHNKYSSHKKHYKRRR